MNPMDLLKNFQDLQSQMADIQNNLKDVRVTGTSGAGMVEITINGNMKVEKISIAPEIVDPDDVTMLEDLVLGALNSALANLQDALKEKAASVAGGLQFPGGFPDLTK